MACSPEDHPQGTSLNSVQVPPNTPANVRLSDFGVEADVRRSSQMKPRTPDRKVPTAPLTPYKPYLT